MTERLTVLQIAQRAMEGIGLPAPASVAVTTSDDNAKQVVQCMYDVALYMMDKHEAGWQALRKHGTFNTAATESQGDIYTLFPDFRSFVNDTMWNTTVGRRIIGPVSDQVWSEAKALDRIGVDKLMYRLFSDELFLYNQATAGEVVTVEYNSGTWIKSGLNRVSVIDANTNISLLHGPTMVFGTQATWLHRNGQDSSEAWGRFEDSLRVRIGKDGGRRILSLRAPQSKGFPVQFRGDTRVQVP